MQQGVEQFNLTVQMPSLPAEPSKPGPSTQKSRERRQTRDEAVLVQLWAHNIERLKSKDSRGLGMKLLELWTINKASQKLFVLPCQKV